MTIEAPPVIGDWYQNDSNESFEVVAFDKNKGLAEIQYFDGTIEEIDLESWYESGLIPIEPPEDWSGSLDMEPQDYGVDLEQNTHLNWSNPLDTFDG